MVTRQSAPLLFICLLAVLGSLACQRAESSGESGQGAAAQPAPLAFEVDQKGTLYTWVAADGSFHLAEKLADIPAESQAAVRVVLEGASSGSATHVLVADLRGKKAGDSASATALARGAWEAKGEAYRQAKVAPLQQKEQADAAAGA